MEEVKRFIVVRREFGKEPLSGLGAGRGGRGHPGDAARR